MKSLSLFFQNTVNRNCAKATSFAVIGDVMLDRYLYGSVERISPEAPIPVLNFEHESNLMGGAGNVVANLCGLGGDVTLIARVGDDEAGRLLRSLIEEKGQYGWGSARFCPVESEITTVKTRIVGNGRQQMLRLDREIKSPLSPEQENQVLETLEELLTQKLGAVILSDYAKGVCSSSLCRSVIEACRRCGVPVFVDPKRNDWQRYSGAELITPNIKELSDAVGRSVPNEDDAVIVAAQELRARYGVKNILVTRSEKGSTFVSVSECFHTPSRAIEVFDVSGAGDTMISAVAFFRLHGLAWDVCCELANTAAQVVVAKAGTCAVSWSELEEALARNEVKESTYQWRRKEYTVADLKDLCHKWKAAGETIVFTNGCFDVFHAGHADSLERARLLGEHLIVGLNSDASVRRLKGKNRPVNTLRDRVRVVSALECVDAVVVFEEDTPERLLSFLCPDVIAKGGDYVPDQVAGRQYAGKVVILPLVPGLSSTSTLEKLKKN